MKLSVVLVLFAITGCATPVPVAQKWPAAPTEIQQPCAALKQLEQGATMRDLMMTVIDNYAAYYHCSSKTQSWQDWYREQQKIFEQVNKK
jgi:hypothetical protein